MSFERPLSPHLQIYRPQITSVLSILHRLTGVALALGLFVLTWWLMAAATGPEAYECFQKIASSTLGILVLTGWSFALFYHLCSGIRHLVMDGGFFFSIPDLYKTGYVMLGAAVAMTAIFWLSIIL